MRTEGLIHKIPVEILLKIFQLVAPPRTRDGLYDLSRLTHVCQFWRTALINQPRVWSSIFVTHEDCREFVEMCLERSHSVTLDVTMNASRWAPVHVGCTCDKDKRGRLLPNERNPCEWHFVFESLATLEHSKRIHTLNIDFYLPDDMAPPETAELSLGSCRFFTLSFPQLAHLGWNGMWLKHINHLFHNPPFAPTVRSLSFTGSWDGLFTQANNLTSLAFKNLKDNICPETFRLFMSNNRSLESLSLDIMPFDGVTKGPPVDLLNLKSFSVRVCPTALSTIIRVPALQRLSSLRILYEDPEGVRLLATGDGVTLDIVSFTRDIAVAWQGLVEYARPTIGHVHLHGRPEMDNTARGSSVALLILADAHTLEVGRAYLTPWYHDFLDDLARLGPQLKAIRFEVWEEMEPFGVGSYGDEIYGRDVLDNIEEVAKCRFENGRPFSAVERLVVCESERSNRQQDYVWRCFYNGRKLGQYVRRV